jgi:phosphosulfolactate phosphohydrolase-like enzyme
MENAPELEADIPFCARESVLDVVPRLAGMRDGVAEITA